MAERNASTSMVLGIIALVLSVVGLGIVGIVCGPIAMQKANQAKLVIVDNSSATAGYITGLIGLILGIISTVFFVIWLLMLIGMASSGGVITIS